MHDLESSPDTVTGDAMQSVLHKDKKEHYLYEQKYRKYLEVHWQPVQRGQGSALTNKSVNHS
jgi:hypothetical protein